MVNHVIRFNHHAKLRTFTRNGFIVCFIVFFICLKAPETLGFNTKKTVAVISRKKRPPRRSCVFYRKIYFIMTFLPFRM